MDEDTVFNGADHSIQQISNNREKQQSSESRTPMTAVTASDLSTTEHDSLKYHLLGPSLTKAGQDSVDQQKVGHTDCVMNIFLIGAGFRDNLQRFKGIKVLQQRRSQRSSTDAKDRAYTGEKGTIREARLGD